MKQESLSEGATEPPSPEDRLLVLLNEIAARLQDARNGYSQAAAHCDQDGLRELFRGQAELRDSLSDQVAELRAVHGDRAGNHMTTDGRVHILWNSLRQAVGLNSTPRIIGECLRWEEQVVGEYESVLREAVVPPTVKKILGLQKNEIEAQVDKLRRLLDECEVADPPS